MKTIFILDDKVKEVGLGEGINYMGNAGDGWFLFFYY